MRRTLVASIASLLAFFALAASAQALPIINWHINPPPPPLELISGRSLFFQHNYIIECKKDRIRIGSPVKYEECEIVAIRIEPNNGTNNLNARCTSPAAAEGEITGGASKEEIAQVSAEGPIVGMGLKIKGKVKFTCGTANFVMTGDPIGRMDPPHVPVEAGEPYTITFEQAEGLQAITKFENGKASGLEFQLIEGKEKSRLEAGAVEGVEEFSLPFASELVPGKAKKTK